MLLNINEEGEKSKRNDMLITKYNLYTSPFRGKNTIDAQRICKPKTNDKRD